MRAVREVAPGMLCVPDPRTGRVNMGLVATGAGAVAIDTANGPEDARALLDAAAALGEPVRFGVITHEHPDHCLGIPALECPLVASVACRDGIRAFRERWGPAGAAVRLPELAFTGGLELELGGLRLVLTRMGGHAPGLAPVWLPDAGILYASDFVFHGRPPFMAPNSDVEAWIAGLEALLALEPRAVVPGHGEPGGPERLREQRDWLVAFVEAVRRLGAGLEPAAVADRLLEELDIPERMHAGYRATVRKLLEGTA